MQTFVILALLILRSVSPDVKASECDYGQSPCEAYAMADGVFIGKVVNTPPDHSTQTGDNNEHTTLVAVEKVYKGYKLRRNIVLHQSTRDNGETFLYGSRYLFYANYNRTGNYWEVRPCGRTHLASYVHDDLRYLKHLPASARRTRIAGEIFRTYSSSEIGRTVERFSGLRVRIIGEGHEYAVITDANGIYELYGAPPGKYSIEPEIPKGLEFHLALHYGPNVRSRVKTLQIELKTGGCSGVTVFLKKQDKEKNPAVISAEPSTMIRERGGQALGSAILAPIRSNSLAS